MRHRPRPASGRCSVAHYRLPLRLQRGQSLVEFVLVVPILLVLLITVADFGRLFATGIAVESAARDAAEISAQEYLRNPPAAIGTPVPSPGDPVYYQAIHDYAIAAVCRELQDLPNSGYASGECGSIPVNVCVHDGADPLCGVVAPTGVSVPAQCSSLAAANLPTNAENGGTENSRYVEVRACYRFSTLFNVPSVQGLPLLIGDFYLDRGRVFTVADY